MVSKTQTEQYLRKTQLPVATKSYTVISHGEIIDTVRKMLTKHGFIITNELYKAEANGDVALGFMQIETLNDPDMAMTFNWTNSYNKMVRFSCSIGGFIYDNQVPFVSTNSQASWNRKHTGTALEETMDVIESMVASADAHFAQIVAMKNKFKSIDVSRKEYAKLLGLLYFDKQVISSEQINMVKREYDKPSFNYTDKGTLWELYKMIMLGIVDQAPKSWYKQQMDINSYVQVLYNIASIELENENEAGELQTDVVNDEIVEILDLMLAVEDEFTPVLPCIGHAVESEKSEIEISEPSLFEDIESKKERLEEIRTELDNESISMGELVELQDLTEYIEDGDVQLLEAAGVPEFNEEVTPMSEELIEMVKEEYGVIETGSPDDGLIGSTDESPESLFDMMEEYDESQGEEVPWFTDENATPNVDLAPSLIPDSMREAVSEILEDKYQSKRSVVNTIEDTDYMVFELDSKEFFVVDK
jgi:hypothetical protein